MTLPNNQSERPVPFGVGHAGRSQDGVDGSLKEEREPQTNSVTGRPAAAATASLSDRVCKNCGAIAEAHGSANMCPRFYTQEDLSKGIDPSGAGTTWWEPA